MRAQALLAAPRAGPAPLPEQVHRSHLRPSRAAALRVLPPPDGGDLRQRPVRYRCKYRPKHLAGLWLAEVFDPSQLEATVAAMVAAQQPDAADNARAETLRRQIADKRIKGYRRALEMDGPTTMLLGWLTEAEAERGGPSAAWPRGAEGGADREARSGARRPAEGHPAPARRSAGGRQGGHLQRPRRHDDLPPRSRDGRRGSAGQRRGGRRQHTPDCEGPACKKMTCRRGDLNLPTMAVIERHDAAESGSEQGVRGGRCRWTPLDFPWYRALRVCKTFAERHTSAGAPVDVAAAPPVRGGAGRSASTRAAKGTRSPKPLSRGGGSRASASARSTITLGRS